MPIDPQDSYSRNDPASPGNTAGDGGAQDSSGQIGPNKRFLSILFRCCNTYGRLYPNAIGSHYEGRCPRCGARTRARIGSDGTDKRLFETQ